MHRLALLLLPAVPALAAPAAPSAAGVPAVAAPPASSAAASVRVADCTSALEPEARSATFEARVKAIAGSDRLAVRFSLQTRGEDELGWRKVTAPGLDAWLTSDAGVGRYGYAKTVQNLAAPASYRVVVRFRWLGPEGDVMRTARETSQACRQLDLRPDLVARRVDVLPAGAATDRIFVVALRNAGRTLAPATTIGLRVGDRVLPPALAPLLEPGAVRSVGFTAPACEPGELLEVTADAGGAVDEADEANVLIVPCPAQ